MRQNTLPRAHSKTLTLLRHNAFQHQFFFFLSFCSLSDIATFAILYVYYALENMKDRIMKRIESLMYLNGFFCCHRPLSHSPMQHIVGAIQYMISILLFFFFFSISRTFCYEFVKLSLQCVPLNLTYYSMHPHFHTWNTTHAPPKYV